MSAFRSLVETYLADRHLASTETGCPVAALGCEMPRQSPAVRQASAQRVERLIAAVRPTRCLARRVRRPVWRRRRWSARCNSPARSATTRKAAPCSPPPAKSLIQQYEAPAAASHRR